MKTINIKVGSKEYIVELAETVEEQETGLQGITELPKDHGMLFVFDTPQTVSF
jgi:uncharacterized membrane protein (UPF0127 family)